MTAVQLPTCGAVSPTRTPRCSRGALLLQLLLALATAPAMADIDLDRLIFEARLRSPAGAATAPLPAGAAAATPAATAATSATTAPLGMLDTITAQNRNIAELLEQEGSFTPRLIQEYLDLGRHYQQLGRHDAAIEVLEDAEHLSRVNAGLENAGLIAIIEASLPSHLARGDQQDIARKQQQLYELTRSNFGSGSRELDPLLQRLADWQLYSFSQGLRSGPVISLGGRSVDPRQLAFGNLYRAQRFYAEAIDNRLQRLDLAAPELLQLERQFVQTQYLAAVRGGLLDNPDFFLNHSRTVTGSRVQRSELHGRSVHYQNGLNAFIRMRFHASQLQADAVELARILVEEADWHLVFGHHRPALAGYAQARQLLEARAAPAQDSLALLQPALPPQLPTLVALPHSRAHFGLAPDSPLQWQGWIDVSFELSRYGSVRRLTIDASSAGTDRSVERRLRRLLQASPFRPGSMVMADGQPQRYQLRYDYTLAPAGAHSPALGLGQH